MGKPSPATIVPVPTNPSWVIIAGPGFGAIALIGLFVFAFLAGTSYKGFICDSFQLLAAVFAFGAASSAAFMGGGAAAQGQLGSTGQQFSFLYGVGGGVAFFVITFVLFSSFPPTCAPALVKFQGDVEIDGEASKGDGVGAVWVGIVDGSWFVAEKATSQHVSVTILAPNSWKSYQAFAFSCCGNRTHPDWIGTSLERPEFKLNLKH